MSNEHPVYWYVMYMIEVFIFASTLTCPWFSSGDKKRRDVVQCIVHVPKYDFYIIASQKGIICQWSSKVSFSISLLFLCVSYDTFQSQKIPNLEEWDKSQSGNLAGNSLVGTCLTLPNLGFLWVFFKYPKISKNGNLLFFSCDSYSS